MSDIWQMNHNTRNFVYNNNEYSIITTSDPSTDGCIREIVINNEYKLDRFINMTSAVFVDIGTNCGIATIILAKQNPNSKVFSFEPDKTVFEFLSTNIKLNNLTNVILNNKAVSKTGIKTITLCANNVCSGANTTCSDENTFIRVFGDKINSYYVDCISLDKIIENYNITSIELLKIDCEGAEYEILYGSTHFQNNVVKNIVGEFHNMYYNTRVDSSANNGQELINYCAKYTNIVNLSVLNIPGY